jgi:hypothetical protein
MEEGGFEGTLIVSFGKYLSCKRILLGFYYGLISVRSKPYGLLVRLG